MTPIDAMETDLELTPEGQGIASGFEMHALVPIVVRFTAEQEGVHSIEIYVDGRHRDSVFFLVRPAGKRRG